MLLRSSLTLAIVPAHTGGADLSCMRLYAMVPSVVPAHTGGADLSIDLMHRIVKPYSPRPHGRGGFKCRGNRLQPHDSICPRPHGRGGFKFRPSSVSARKDRVPAHTGGADLSKKGQTPHNGGTVPAHTGGADLSSGVCSWLCRKNGSPPTRAGRI